jgi:hypothetical protein
MLAGFSCTDFHCLLAYSCSVKTLRLPEFLYKNIWLVLDCDLYLMLFYVNFIQSSTKLTRFIYLQKKQHIANRHVIIELQLCASLLALAVKALIWHPCSHLVATGAIIAVCWTSG